VESLAGTVGLTAARLEKMLGKPADTPARGSRGPGVTARQRGRTAMPGRPSVVRRAITLLLNHPQAGDNLDIEKLAGIDRPGVGLLHDLIETVQAEPNITTAGLLERWRHDEQGRHLGKLAAGEVPMEDDFDAAAELTACLDQLVAAGRRDRINYLIEKQRVNSLTDEELAELRWLSRGPESPDGAASGPRA
jgi:DNA primase